MEENSYFEQFFEDDVAGTRFMARIHAYGSYNSIVSDCLSKAEAMEKAISSRSYRYFHNDIAIVYEVSPDGLKTPVAAKQFLEGEWIECDHLIEETVYK